MLSIGHSFLKCKDTWNWSRALAVQMNLFHNFSNQVEKTNSYSFAILNKSLSLHSVYGKTTQARVRNLK